MSNSTEMNFDDNNDRRQGDRRQGDRRQLQNDFISKDKTKGGHMSSHFKSKNKDILTEVQTKDRFNRIGIPESDWHIHIGLTCGKVATAVHQGNGDLFNIWSLQKCVSS